VHKYRLPTRQHVKRVDPFDSQIECVAGAVLDPDIGNRHRMTLFVLQYVARLQVFSV
jgi:hypothetical protein